MKSLHHKKNKAIEIACCFAFGFFAYIALEYLFRGYSYITMGICGGIGFCVIGQLNEGRRIGLIWQGMTGTLLITAMELIVGSVLLYKGIRMWDYTDQWCNYKGLICPLFSALWFVLSIAVVFIDDWLRKNLFGCRCRYCWIRRNRE